MSGVEGERAVIIGAGVAGLATALALARSGRASIVLEQRPVLGGEGAGIQIGPNGTRILAALGTGEDLAAAAGTPGAVIVREASSGRRLAELPLGAWLEDRHGAPYWTLHRADLNAALAAAARRDPRIELVTGERVETLTPEADGSIEVTSTGGRRLVSRIVVGADGVWSEARRIVCGGELAYTGFQAVRNVLPANAVPAAVEAGKTGLWLSERAHIVHYPLRQGREVAVTIILAGPEPPAGWSLDVPDMEIEALAASFAAPLANLLRAASGWKRWGCFALAPDDQQRAASSGPIALVGDAAHPILPFLAQGAVLALEDSQVLAAALAASPADPAAAFDRYRAARRERVARVAAASRRNGRIYHLTGPLGLARDFAFRTLPGARIMAGLDWLYGWRAP